MKIQTNKELMSQIKSDCIWGIGSLLCIISLLMFVFYSVSLVLQHPVNKLIIFGFFTVLFTIIIFKYDNDINSNKILLEIRELKKGDKK